MRIDVNPRWRVVIVDDRALSKAAVAEAVATLERYRPDVVVLALGPPDGGGAEELKSGLDAVRRENEDLKKALESRKLVERAKGVLMERHGLSEAEAFRRIQNPAAFVSTPSGLPKKRAAAAIHPGWRGAATAGIHGEIEPSLLPVQRHAAC